MLRLDQSRRNALSEPLRDLANLVVGALTVGQFVGEQPPSVRLILFGAFGWLFLVVWGIFRAGEATMVNALILIYTIVIMSGIIVLLDWLDRRKDRQSKQPKLPF